ncbi:type IV pilus twitching motility protein PilT [Candidatus Riflebacteria bacterium]
MNLLSELQDLLRLGYENRASDIHLHPDMKPYFRIDGFIQAHEENEALTKSKLISMLTALLDEGQRKFFAKNKVIDFAYELSGVCRFRVNIFLEDSGISAVFRLIPSSIYTIEELEIPKGIVDLLKYHSGLILITGPTGSGKSTTLAAIIDFLNKTKHFHIVTLEYPIEFVYQNQKSSITQREVGGDTPSFEKALLDVSRQDPDVVLIGEMRDRRTIELALNVAESGKLVFATLHTVNANQSAERIVNVFSADEQSQRRHQFASVVRAVVSQTLIPKASGTGRVAAFEILVATAAVRNCIREGKTHQLGNYIETGKDLGMQTMATGIQQLAGRRIISPDVAQHYINTLSLDKN